MLRRIVVAYFLAVMADAAISLASIITTPSLETFSNSFSLLMFGLTLVVVFLAFRVKLRPIVPVLIPALLSLCVSPGMGGELTASTSVPISLLALAVHTGAMLAVIGVVSLIVYDQGLAFLRRGWINSWAKCDWTVRRRRRYCERRVIIGTKL